MERHVILTSEAPRPPKTYSQAIQYSGALTFISGQTPHSLDGKLIQGLTFEEQVKVALSNVEAIAQAAGSSLRNAVKVNVYLKDIANRQVFDAIYVDYVGSFPPARTLAQSGFIDFDVEVDAVVAAGD